MLGERKIRGAQGGGGGGQEFGVKQLALGKLSRTSSINHLPIMINKLELIQLSTPPHIYPKQTFCFRIVFLLGYIYCNKHNMYLYGVQCA